MSLGEMKAKLATPERVRADMSLRAEFLILAAMLAVFLAVNLATAGRAPVVWTDEVMFTDAAANAALGHGFTSTAWPFQRADATWGGNAPLHAWLLVPWLKVWGFNVTAV